MKYIIFSVIGITVLLTLLLYLVIKTYKMIKIKEVYATKIWFNVVLISVLTLFIFVTALSVSYNYFYERGVNLSCQEKYNGAIEAFKKALAIRTKLGNSAKLLEEEKFPFFFSTEIDVRIVLAESYKNLKDYQNAIKEYQAILTIDKNNYKAVAGIAESFFLIRNFEKAKHFYQELTEIHPKEKNFNYYYQMGKAYMVLLNYKDAIKSFKTALAFGEKDEVINRYLEICYGEEKEKRKMGRF